MGMYDNVRYECPCPRCGETVRGFQSKDGPCDLGTVEVHAVHYFYSECCHCNEQVEFLVRPIAYRLERINPGPSFGSPRWVEIHGPVCWHPRVKREPREGDDEYVSLLVCPDCGRNAIGYHIAEADGE